MSVYQKILAVQKAIKPVPKKGTLEVNGKKQYDFARDADILATVKELANNEGLIITASQESSEIGYFEVSNQYGTRTQRWAKARMKFEIIDVESPQESIVSYFDGYAEDTSDKPLTKAITSAGKYFMLKFFGVPTGDDPEADPTVHEETTRKKQSSAQEQNKTPGAAGWANMLTQLKAKHNISSEEIKSFLGGTIPDAMKNGRVAELERAWQQLSVKYEQKAS